MKLSIKHQHELDDIIAYHDKFKNTDKTSTSHTVDINTFMNISNVLIALYPIWQCNRTPGKVTITIPY